MINVQHVYCAHTEVIYYMSDVPDEEKILHGLTEHLSGTMDDIAEHICKILVKHNFCCADVCDATTGEVLMIIERS